MKALSLALLFYFLVSCTHSTNPDAEIDYNYQFPLKQGSSWNYHISNKFVNIRPDTLNLGLFDSYLDIKLTVGTDTVINSIPLIQVKESGQDLQTSFNFYRNEESGFFRYAYKGVGQGLPKVNSKYEFKLNGYVFNDFNNLVNTLINNKPYLNRTNDSITFFSSPLKVYAYPIFIGKEWEFISDEIKIDKTVIGKDVVITNIGAFNCYKIKWKYKLNNSNWDENIAAYEYINEKGRMKLEFYIKDLLITTAENPDGIGLVDVRIDYELTGMNN